MEKRLHIRYEPFSLTKQFDPPYVERQPTENSIDRGYPQAVNPPPKPGAKVFRVFVFGGSTVAGIGIHCPDDFVPSVISSKLNGFFPDTSFEVFNFGIPGFDQANEIVLLTKLLRDGHIPDLVIIYDGSNDFLHYGAFGKPHYRYNTMVEAHLHYRSYLGTLYNRTYSVLHRYSATARLLTGFDPRGTWVETLDGKTKLVRFDKSDFITSPERIRARAEKVADKFAGNYRLVKALGAEYGFKFGFFLQPTLFTAGNLTDGEKSYMGQMHGVIGEAHRAAYAAVRRKFADRAATPKFYDVSQCLLDKPKGAFMDYVHIYGIAVHWVVDCMARHLNGLASEVRTGSGN